MVISMFSNYKIINNVLYLYVDDKCEIGSLFNREKQVSISKKIRNYIKEHKINFNGTKVVLLLSGLLLVTIYLNNDLKKEDYKTNEEYKYVVNVVDRNISKIRVKEKIDEVKSNVENKEFDVKEENNNNNLNIKKEQMNIDKSTQNSNNTIDNNTSISNNNVSNLNNVSSDKLIKLRRFNGEIIEMDLEEYLVGVVAAEMPASFNIEALKAQSVVARTYTLKLLESNREITDDVKTQVYKSNNELQNMWGSNYNNYYQKVKNAVEQTKGLVIKYNGSLIDAVYHSTSNGYTEDAINVWGNSIPYLKTVTSPWDTSSTSYLRNIYIGFDAISNALKINFDSSSTIDVISRDESNRILKVRFNDKEYSGVEIRNLLGLRSADFDAVILENGVNFTTRGYGHGVGMSQYGANGMAKSGYSFEQILNHYYLGIKIVKV